jgi:hypothetical protein
MDIKIEDEVTLKGQKDTWVVDNVFKIGDKYEYRLYLKSNPKAVLPIADRTEIEKTNIRSTEYPFTFNTY